MRETKAKTKPEVKVKTKTAAKFKLIKNENWQPPRKPKIRIRINLEDLPPAA